MATAQDRRINVNVPLAVTRPDRVPAARYYDAEFYELERTQLWPRVWQMACRLEEIPRPGDFVEYKIFDQSVIVVRVDADTVKAFDNACRHRGVALVEGRGNLPSGFICPFHGWCFGLDGANTYVFSPDLFDAHNLDPNELALTERRVELWGGCAFINFDDNAPPLRDCIEPFASFHDVWKVENLRTEWWYAALLPVNWKLAMEAFMEGYHVTETHPQLLMRGTGRGDAVYVAAGNGPNNNQQFKRPPSGPVDSKQFIETILHSMRTLNVGMAGMLHQKDVAAAETLANLELPADLGLAAMEFRRQFNDAVMAAQRAVGVDPPDLNEIDALGLGSSVNFCFPHYFLLPMGSSASSYRIRPLGPEQTLFELWSLTRYPEGEEPPPPQAPVPMRHDDPMWPPIPKQDFSNLPRQQAGLHAKGFEYMRLSDKVEGMIGNYQHLIDGFLGGLDYDVLVPAMQQVSGPIDAPIRDLGF